MAHLPDALDGSPACEVVTFALDRQAYAIALHAEHARELRAAVAKFVRHARVTAVAPRFVNAGRSPARIDNTQREAIRRWAREHGHAMPGNRVTPDVIDAWERAHQPGSPPPGD